MNAPVRTRPANPDRGEPGTGVASVFGSALGDGASYLGGSTPGRMRALSLLCIALIAAAAVFTTLAALQLERDTKKIANNTAPVLISTQDVYGSLAEANSAAAALDNPVREGIYRAAIDNASRDLEVVSRLVGDDPESHEALEEISADLTRYVREMEAARTAENTDELQRALDIVEDEIAPELRGTITERATDKLDDQIDSSRLLLILAAASVILALVVLLVGQAWLAGKTRRLFNIPMVIGTVLLLAAGAVLAFAWVDRQDALDIARSEALDSIQVTGEIQEELLEFRNAQTKSLISGESMLNREAVQQIAGRVETLVDQAGSRADSNRERAASQLLSERWDAYLGAATQIDQLLEIDAPADGTEPSDVRIAALQEAQKVAESDGISTFDGVNTMVESVLFDNRNQFVDAIAEARSGLRWRWVLTLAATVLAALFVLWGWGQRIGEYR